MSESNDKEGKLPELLAELLNEVKEKKHLVNQNQASLFGEIEKLRKDTRKSNIVSIFLGTFAIVLGYTAIIQAEPQPLQLNIALGLLCLCMLIGAFFFGRSLGELFRFRKR